MNSMEVLNEVFRLVFDDKDLLVTSRTTADDVDGWDSLTHVNLILAVESQFKIRFTQKELLAMKSVGDLHAAIVRKVGM